MELETEPAAATGGPPEIAAVPEVPVTDAHKADSGKRFGALALDRVEKVMEINADDSEATGTARARSPLPLATQGVIAEMRRQLSRRRSRQSRAV